jgi:uncharacterized protein (TIGR02118 family)
MYKAVGFWSWPAEHDLDAFEHHYQNVHFPLAERLPGIRRLTAVRAGDDARGSGFFRVAEVYWDDRAGFERAAASEEWQAMARDAGQLMERFGVTLTSATGEEIEQSF